MVKVRIEEKPIFRIIGRKTWISGTDNELFGEFWQKCGKEGLFRIFETINKNKPGLVTNSMVLGLSCVEKAPNNRSFYFYIAIESNEFLNGSDLEEYHVPACKWAIFENRGKMPNSLVESEMYAFKDWLPRSKFIHSSAPEIEVYPPCEGGEENIMTEFWLPIKEK